MDEVSSTLSTTLETATSEANRLYTDISNKATGSESEMDLSDIETDVEAYGAANIEAGNGNGNDNGTDPSTDTPTETETAKLNASDGDSNDGFGWSVAMSRDGSRALIGADGDEDPNGDDAGSAYVFSQGGGSWSEEAKLTPSDGDSEDFFGNSVAVSGDGSTALVGQSADEDPNGDDAGSAYVFSRADGGWSEEATLSASDGDDGDGFGPSVAVSGDGSTALISAPLDEEDPYDANAGSAYVFE
jgi:hypothetical protein